jgi:hypothetical protein
VANIYESCEIANAERERAARKSARAPQVLPRLARVASSGAPLHTGGTRLRAAFAVTALFLSIGITHASAASADPPYQDCNQARADGRSSIPSTDPAYRPELDLDGDGLACEGVKSRRSTR